MRPVIGPGGYCTPTRMAMCTRGCVLIFILVEMVLRPVFLGLDMVRTWSETGCGGHLFSELVTTATSVSRHLHGWRLCEHVSSLVRVLSVCSIRYLITELLQFASQREPELPNPCSSRFPLCLMRSVSFLFPEKDLAAFDNSAD